MVTELYRLREPAVAGMFYPAKPDRLRREVCDLLDEACESRVPGRLRGLIVPHAGYRFSGPIAACGFKQLAGLAAARPPRVFLLGPAHYVPVTRVSLAAFEYFATPLGEVPQDTATLADLARDARTYEMSAVAHEPEHCLEVELPFLQIVLPEFKLVAMLCREPDVERVADDLAARVTDDDLVVVSSDLSHFHPYYEARRRDQRFLKDVVAGDILHASLGEACGLQPILVLMRLAQLLGWRAVLTDYRNSGDTGGPKDRVVGYAAVAFSL